MEMIINGIIFTLGQGFAFNVVLPLWYFLMKVVGM